VECLWKVEVTFTHLESLLRVQQLVLVVVEHDQGER